MTAVLDAYALIAVLRSEAVGDEVEHLMSQGPCAVTTVNLAEVADRSARLTGRSPEAVRALVESRLSDLVDVIPVTEEHAWRAADLRARHYDRKSSAVSLADCFLLAAARPGDAIVTSDAAVTDAARAEGLDVVALPDSSGRRP